MALDDWGREHLATVTGLAPLPSRPGLDALALVLSSTCVESCPLVGDLSRFRSFLRSHRRPRRTGTPRFQVGRRALQNLRVLLAERRTQSRG